MTGWEAAAAAARVHGRSPAGGIHAEHPMRGCGEAILHMPGPCTAVDGRNGRSLLSPVEAAAAAHQQQTQTAVRRGQRHRAASKMRSPSTIVDSGHPSLRGSRLSSSAPAHSLSPMSLLLRSGLRSGTTGSARATRAARAAQPTPAPPSTSYTHPRTAPSRRAVLCSPAPVRTRRLLLLPLLAVAALALVLCPPLASSTCYPYETITVDTEDPESAPGGVGLIGSWFPPAGPCAGCNKHLETFLQDSNTNKGGSFAQFWLPVVRPGRYSLRTIFSPSTSRARNVPISVISSGNATLSASYSLDQRGTTNFDEDGFFELGELELPAGELTVTFSNAGTDGKVIIDAVRLVCAEPTVFVAHSAPGFCGNLNNFEAGFNASTCYLACRDDPQCVGYTVSDTLCFSNTVHCCNVTSTATNTRAFYKSTGCESTPVGTGPTAPPTTAITTTRSPTPSPTAPPTAQSPTPSPSASPTAPPSPRPTMLPTAPPLAQPTMQPTSPPSSRPTTVPTAQPSSPPTTLSPTDAPTASPTLAPTAVPTVSPTTCIAQKGGSAASGCSGTTSVDAETRTATTATAAGVAVTGAWQEPTTAPCTGSGCSFRGSSYFDDGNTRKGELSITFSFPVAAAGNHNLQLGFVRQADSASNVQVTITSTDNSTSAPSIHLVVLNQQSVELNSDGFASLGTLCLGAGRVNVTITNAGTDGRVSVDSMRLVCAAGDGGSSGQASSSSSGGGMLPIIIGAAGGLLLILLILLLVVLVRRRSKQRGTAGHENGVRGTRTSAGPRLPEYTDVETELAMGRGPIKVSPAMRRSSAAASTSAAAANGGAAAKEGGGLLAFPELVFSDSSSDLPPYLAAHSIERRAGRVPTVPFSALRLRRELGRGLFAPSRTHSSEVTPGTLDTVQGGQLVAVKTFDREGQGFRRTGVTAEEFEESMAVLGTLLDLRVVRMLAVAEPSGGRRKHYVLEYMPGGSLAAWMQSQEAAGQTFETVGIANVLHLGTQMTAGLRYLETKGVVVRPALRPASVLLGEGLSAKIGDIGLSEGASDAWYMRGLDMNHPLPDKGYFALETLRGGRVTSASNAWSFGMIMWRLFALGSRPRGGGGGGGGGAKAAAAKDPREPFAEIRRLGDFITLLESGERPTLPESCPLPLVQVTQLCWLADPMCRPRFGLLATQVRELEAELSSVAYAEPADSYARVGGSSAMSTFTSHIYSRKADYESLGDSEYEEIKPERGARGSSHANSGQSSRLPSQSQRPNSSQRANQSQQIVFVGEDDLVENTGSPSPLSAPPSPSKVLGSQMYSSVAGTGMAPTIGSSSDGEEASFVLGRHGSVNGLESSTDDVITVSRNERQPVYAQVQRPKKRNLTQRRSEDGSVGEGEGEGEGERTLVTPYATIDLMTDPRFGGGAQRDVLTLVNETFDSHSWSPTPGEAPTRRQTATRDESIYRDIKKERAEARRRAAEAGKGSLSSSQSLSLSSGSGSPTSPSPAAAAALGGSSRPNSMEPLMPPAVPQRTAARLSRSERPVSMVPYAETELRLENGDDRDGYYLLPEVENPARRVDLEEWEISAELLLAKTQIGSGFYGNVYRAVLRTQPPSMVAVKTLKSTSSRESRKDFLMEARSLAVLDHPNVVRFIGVVTLEEPWQLVVELVEYGDVKANLTHCRRHGVQLTATEQLTLAAQIADGMNHLAENSVVHRDLACRNILLGPDNVVKISDLGLSRELTNEVYAAVSRQKLPVRWMAPETLTRREFSSASDVWAFGVVLWELCTYGLRPYPHMSVAQVVDFVLGGETMEVPPGLAHGLGDLMLCCWSSEPASRPSFIELKSALQAQLLVARRREPIRRDLGQIISEVQDRAEVEETLRRRSAIYSSVNGSTIEPGSPLGWGAGMAGGRVGLELGLGAGFDRETEF